MENHLIIAYLASAVLAIVIYISKAREKRDLEEQVALLRSNADKELTALKNQIENAEKATLLSKQLENLNDEYTKVTEILRRKKEAEDWLEYEKPRLDGEREALEKILANLVAEINTKQRELQNLNDKIQELIAQAEKLK